MGIWRDSHRVAARAPVQRTAQCSRCLCATWTTVARGGALTIQPRARRSASAGHRLMLELRPRRGPPQEFCGPHLRRELGGLSRPPPRPVNWQHPLTPRSRFAERGAGLWSAPSRATGRASSFSVVLHESRRERFKIRIDRVQNQDRPLQDRDRLTQISIDPPQDQDRLTQISIDPPQDQDQPTQISIDPPQDQDQPTQIRIDPLQDQDQPTSRSGSTHLKIRIDPPQDQDRV